MNPDPAHSAQLQRLDDEVAVITICNPPVNALTTGVFTAIVDIAQQLREKPARAVVVTGQRDAFAVGGEISETRRIHFEGRTDIPDAELDDAVGRITDPQYVRALGVRPRSKTPNTRLAA